MCVFRHAPIFFCARKHCESDFKLSQHDSGVVALVRDDELLVVVVEVAQSHGACAGAPEVRQGVWRDRAALLLLLAALATPWLLLLLLLLLSLCSRRSVLKLPMQIKRLR